MDKNSYNTIIDKKIIAEDMIIQSSKDKKIPDTFQVFTVKITVITKNEETFTFIKDKFNFLSSSSLKVDDSVKDISLVEINGIYEENGEVKRVIFEE